MQSPLKSLHQANLRAFRLERRLNRKRLLSDILRSLPHRLRTLSRNQPRLKRPLR
jgi:hypothetical protein